MIGDLCSDRRLSILVANGWRSSSHRIVSGKAATRNRIRVFKVVAWLHTYLHIYCGVNIELYPMSYVPIQPQIYYTQAHYGCGRDRYSKVL